jgi:hypothetical protein
MCKNITNTFGKAVDDFSVGTMAMKTTLSILTCLAILSGCKTAPVSTPAANEVAQEPQERISWVLVFRYYDDDFAPTERIKDAIHDWQLIRESARELQTGGYRAHGRSGPIVFTISSVDVPEWKKIINKLHSCNELRYYTEYGFDEHGCGLAPLQ